MTEQAASTGSHMEHLMDMELENRQGKGRIHLERAKIGDYLAGGEGAVFGSRLNGVILWDLYQEQGEFITGAQLRGTINTDDGSAVALEAIGHMIRPLSNQPTLWFTAASVQFETTSRQYQWLEGTLGILQGKYDVAIGRHSFRVFILVFD